MIRNFTYYGNPTFSNLRSMNFDGINKTANVNNMTSLDNVGAVSYSIWVKPTSLGANSIPFSRYKNGISNEFEDIVFLTTGAVRVNVRNTVLTYADTAIVTITTGVWQHFILVFDGSGATNADRLKLYKNGSNIPLTFTGTVPATTCSGGTPIFMLGNRPTHTLYYDGLVDEFAAFNYALSGSQVTSVYNGGTPKDLNNTAGLTPPIHSYRGEIPDDQTLIADVGSLANKDLTPVNMVAGDFVSDTP